MTAIKKMNDMSALPNKRMHVLCVVTICTAVAEFCAWKNLVQLPCCQHGWHTSKWRYKIYTYSWRKINQLNAKTKQKNKKKALTSKVGAGCIKTWIDG
jgi:hypothetical protein